VTVTTEPLGSARVVRWSQPGRLNAWTRATIEATADAIEAAGADAAVRCVVVRGGGTEFSAGDDLHSAVAADAAEWATTIAAFQRLTRVTLAAPVPVLAAIDGVCIGGALEFAASCDLRIATHRARFATPEVRIGLAATNAGTLLLPEVLGETAARELLRCSPGRCATRTGRWPTGSCPSSSPRMRWTSGSRRSPRSSAGPRAPRSRARSRCSTPASATCAPRPWSARSVRASSCSPDPTRPRRCAP
jgi:hypothetical protein